MSYIIFSDSGSDLSNSRAQELNVKIIPLLYTIKNETYDSITDELMKFTYDSLRQKEKVSTSCANIYTIQNALEEELKKGNDVLYIAFSSGLSATYANGVEACKNLKELYPNRKIFVLDSLCASGGLTLLLINACLLRDQGKSIDEVVSFIEENKLRLTHLFTVDEMYYLYSGGRITKSTYLIARFAQIKPIMHVTDDGKLTATDKVISRRKSLNTIISKIVESIENPEEQIIFISHGDCLEDAEYIKRKLLEKITVRDVIIDYIAPVIGVHSGPGTMAVFYFSKHRI